MFRLYFANVGKFKKWFLEGRYHSFKEIQDNLITFLFTWRDGESERKRRSQFWNMKNTNIIYLNVHVIGHCISINREVN